MGFVLAAVLAVVWASFLLRFGCGLGDILVVFGCGLGIVRVAVSNAVGSVVLVRLCLFGCAGCVLV